MNDCSIHPLVPELPFGGVGTRGWASPHGHWGFQPFTNARGVLCIAARRLTPISRFTALSEHVRMHGIIAKLMP